MVSRILVPLDGSEPAWVAFEYALDEFPDVDLVLLNVIDPVEGGYTVGAGIPQSSEAWYEDAREDAEAMFDEARERATDHGGTTETATEVGRPARTIVEYADADDVDQVVMGSHGRSGVTRILLGSVAETVLRRSTVTVTVVR